MSVFGGRSMLQRTVERVLPLKPARIMVVTNTLQAQETRKQLAELGSYPVDVIEEPVGRNTAPAIALAAAIVARHDPDATMVVLPADHFIRDEAEFCRVVTTAAGAAGQGALVTLGIEPTRPETGYGYIEADTANTGAGVHPVRRFVEKPDAARALEFLAARNFFWNSGMFIWQVKAIRGELSRQMPELAAAIDTLSFGGSWDLAHLKPQIERLYPEIRGESIDYGVMERAAAVLVIPASFGWSDVGSWSALPEVIEADDTGNVAIAVPDLIAIDATDSLVYGNGKLAALVGVEGLIVVDTPDALLVCRQDRAQDVKKVVEQLQRKGLVEYL
jgi:mannose-1-phosphate guanylyltransferase